MPKMRLGDALAEKEEAASVTCRTCSTPASEAHEPYCLSCFLYWQDVDNGLFEDKDPSP